MSYDVPMQETGTRGTNGYTADPDPRGNSDKKRIVAAAGNSWQRLRSNTVEDSATARVPTGYNADQIQYFDYNLHSTKKLVSSTLLDVALLMVNVSQLKTVYLAGKSHPFYIVLMTLLVISIVLQVVSGLLLIWLGKININEPDESKHKQASILNNIVLVLVFLLTLVNIIVSSLGISNEIPYTNNIMGNLSGS